MNIEQIIKLIEEQKQNLINKNQNSFNSKEDFKEFIEASFLEDGDITNRSDEFDKDVDLVEVENLRREAMIDVLLHHNL